MIVFPLTELLTVVNGLSPAMILALWGGACTLGVVGAVVLVMVLQRPAAPFVTLPPATRPAPKLAAPSLPPATPEAMPLPEPPSWQSRGRHALDNLDRSQAGIPAAVLIAAARAAQAEVASHRVGGGTR